MRDDELRSRWLAALRSGAYRQGHETLRQDAPGGGTHCCLGVLCDLADPAGWHREPDGWHWHDVRPTQVPAAVLGRLGLTMGTGRALARFNDRLAYDFARIAATVEATG